MSDIENKAGENPAVKVANKPAAKPKKSKIRFVKFQNKHTTVLKIIGATIRPGEMSKAYTVEQAAIVKKQMQPYVENEWIKEVKL